MSAQNEQGRKKEQIGQLLLSISIKNGSNLRMCVNLKRVVFLGK